MKVLQMSATVGLAKSPQLLFIPVRIAGAQHLVGPAFHFLQWSLLTQKQNPDT